MSAAGSNRPADYRANVMAGHSQFKNIMHRKGRQDKARSKLFSKLAREITTAAKLGLPDPAMNARLRAAIIAARAENMPKDDIERAIKKSQGGDARELRRDPLRGLWSGRRGGHRRGADRQPQPHRRRGARGVHQERRQSRRDRRGVVHVRSCRHRRVSTPGVASADAMLEAAIEAGADDVVSSDDGHEIYAAQDSFARVSPRRWRRSSASRARPRSSGSRRIRSRSTTTRASRCWNCLRRSNEQRRRAERLRQLRSVGCGGGQGQRGLTSRHHPPYSRIWSPPS